MHNILFTFCMFYFKQGLVSSGNLENKEKKKISQS